MADYHESLRAHIAELEAKHERLRRLRIAALENCGQDIVCATPPGCLRHWEERNHELAAQVANDELEIRRIKRTF